MRQSTNLKQWLTEIVDCLGFENWRESRIAESLLDETSSQVEWFDENQYLLVGVYELHEYEFLIDWRTGLQPRSHCFRESPYLREVVKLCTKLSVDDKRELIKRLQEEISA